jgi:AraC-like DNA-binding protein
MAPEQYQAILGLLKVFAEQLATVCNQILVTEAATENPQITRVREFIGQNLTEDIHVADCARVAHMSAFYFCKRFKCATGLSFTEYLSRLRTEMAKTRLLQPHARVSEVAFAVGFQSLSQFNRVFKRVTGQCPSDYRHDLVATLAHPARSPAFGEITGERRPPVTRRDRIALSRSPT